MALLNPNALEIVKAYVEPGMKDVTPDTRLQFERHGYFVADRVDSVVGKPVFNRVTTLKDSPQKNIGIQENIQKIIESHSEPQK
jgi:glutaminyl-tRNA synthetase